MRGFHGRGGEATGGGYLWDGQVRRHSMLLVPERQLSQHVAPREKRFQHQWDYKMKTPFTSQLNSPRGLTDYLLLKASPVTGVMLVRKHVPSLKFRVRDLSAPAVDIGGGSSLDGTKVAASSLSANQVAHTKASQASLGMSLFCSHSPSAEPQHQTPPLTMLKGP
jgi:hypothetical protein